MEKSSVQAEQLEQTKTNDLVAAGGIFLDIEGRELSLKTAKDGHVSQTSTSSTREATNSKDHSSSAAVG